MTLVNQAKTKAEQAGGRPADTYQRKFNELRYAIAFEEKYSKDWILERYLNIAYFGDGAYGIEAASRHYFSKPASDAHPARGGAARRAGEEPDRLRPDEQPRRGPRSAATSVLARMAQLNVISRSEAQRAPSPAGSASTCTATHNGCVSSTGAVLLRLRPSSTSSPTPTWARPSRTGARLLFSGGLTIKTTRRPALSSARPTRPSHAHVNPTDQAIGGLAMVRAGHR